MKELSIEQKAQRYDEAIERAEKWRNATNVNKIPTFANKVIEEIFPELKESEDERIRKALLNEFILLQSQGYKFAGLEGEEIITWLEKQGEKGINGNNEEVPNSAWSEVDKKRIIELIGIFESAIDGGQVNLPYRLLKNYIRILKSCMPQNAKTTTGTEMIREERLRQIESEGYDALHDRHHTPQVLCRAAAAYALYDDQSALIANAVAKLWPWSNEFWKPKTQLRNLVRAGALIAAAIDKLQSEKGE